MDKSSFIIGKHATTSKSAQIGTLTGMRQARFPFTYLGCPIYHGRAKTAYFDDLIRKFRKKLQGWYSKLLSPGGRIILIKHVLTSIPIHLMAAMQLPVMVIQKLEKFMNHFLWNDFEGNKRRVWKTWKDLCYPTAEGGLGFKDLNAVQASFSCKLWWKLKTEQGLWASKFINSDFPLYKLHVWKLLSKTQESMDDLTRYVGGAQWIWTPSTSGKFSVSSAYDSVRRRKSSIYAIGDIWKPYIPIKISFFLWRLQNHLLPFPLQLRKMGFNGPFKCPFCAAEDSYFHAFWHCYTAQAIWTHFQHLLGYKGITNSWIDFMESWVNNPYHGALGKILKLLFFFILWELWKMRTSVLYGNVLIPLESALVDISNNITQAAGIMKLRYQSMEDHILISSGFLKGLQPATKKKVILVLWNFPGETQIKINCDGSSLGNPGPAGGGFIIWDSNGQVLQAGYEAYGTCSNMEAEIKAMRVGILHGLEYHKSAIVVESDSYSLIQMLEGKTEVPWRFYDDITELSAMISQHHIHIQHIYREGNAVADYLAKIASTSQQSNLLDCSRLDGPLGLLILRDNLGLPALRIQQRIGPIAQ